jgi:hypothetical protein
MENNEPERPQHPAEMHPEAGSRGHNRLYILARGSEEWDCAWNRLWRTRVGGITPKHQDYDPATGEDWQYMGTASYLQPDGSRRWMHDFRHRWHPISRKRLYVKVEASPGWDVERNNRRDDAASD